MNQSALPIQPSESNQTRRTGIVQILKKHLWGYLFLLPALLLFAIFLWLPIIKGFVYSFYHIDFVKGNTFVGWDNYKTVFDDPDVGKSIRNTLYYMGLALVMGFWVPIVFSIAISEIRRFQGFFRVAAYLPNVIPVVVLYGLWRWFYDSVGPINAGITKVFGGEGIAFMTDTKWSMISIVFMETWQQFGSAMLLYLAAVLSIPRDWYEAAEIDGAGVWMRIRHITLPSVKGLIVLMLLLQLIGTSQGFQAQLAMLDGGPMNATLTYSLLIVKYATTRLELGVASAMGVLMFMVLSVLAVIQFRLQSKGDN
ncbi:carbohydrate ABC transporter permease [Paenibacillus kobensis]|uniref:carbohydrate ABC transporter permease n=1 Tax=Paenibacillus kobensis TaxID=59841 RepID=UPI000FD8BD4C|nr:sugar ABC transporter permease [Paenibacillus kobensis]